VRSCCCLCLCVGVFLTGRASSDRLQQLVNGVQTGCCLSSASPTSCRSLCLPALPAYLLTLVVCRRIMARMGTGLDAEEHAALMQVASSPLFAQTGTDGEDYVNYVKLIKHLN
jgi:hypothetical protein